MKTALKTLLAHAITLALGTLFAAPQADDAASRFHLQEQGFGWYSPR